MGGLTLGFVFAVSVVAAPAQALPTPADLCDRPNNTHTRLMQCVNLDNVRRHQAAFQEFADNNDDEYYPGPGLRALRATRTASTGAGVRPLGLKAANAEAAGAEAVIIFNQGSRTTAPALLRCLRPPSRWTK